MYGSVQTTLKANIFVEPACGERDIVITTSVCCMCVLCVCMREVSCSSFQICPGRNLYIYAWIQNNLAQFLSLRSRSAI